jgi:ATP-dependent exoDNAse (exonuclease V) beta subunit
MTVHKAKGLEFPVVILADITAKLAQRDPDRYIDPASNLCVLKLAGWMPAELREHAPLEAQRDEAEGVRLAYVAATRARDLLVVPAVGDKSFDDGWLRPLNRAIYPSVERRREQRVAPGCPSFKSKDSVLQRPDDDPATTETVCPGLHEFAASEGDPYSVSWWDPHDLHLDAKLPSGIRRPELITKEAAPDVVEEGLAAYQSWRATRDAAVEAASQPTLRVHAATAWAARSDLGVATEQLSDVEVMHLDLPRDRPSGASFGSLVHSVLSMVPLDADVETIRLAADVHGRILDVSEREVAAAPGVVARILAHPLLIRARAAAANQTLQRELPITLRSDSGELIEGFIDLAFDENGETTLVDFKTDAGIGAHLPRYKRQLQAYGAALHRVTGRQVRLVLLAAGIGE